MREKPFAAEAELVAAFCACIAPERWGRRGDPWIQYHESCGWDLLLARPTGAQIGIEAKLVLNAKVLEQALPRYHAATDGPDYRAVLVPGDGLQNHLVEIARHLGITIIEVTSRRGGRVVDGRWADGGPWEHDFSPNLPDGTLWGQEAWPHWCPAERCKLPEYVPDVTGGRSAPVQLSPWKIAAIKLLIVLERRGFVTRRDMKALDLSPTRWTAHGYGFLSLGPDGYVRNARTPDLRAQHPVNWAQIEADLPKWGAAFDLARRAA